MDTVSLQCTTPSESSRNASLPGNSPETSRTETLPANQGGFRLGKCTLENAAAFAYDVYEGFQRKEHTLAVAIDLEDAYNRVQFNLLMYLLVQYEVSLIQTRWMAGALLGRQW